MNNAEITAATTAIITAARAAFAGAGHISTSPDMTFIGGGKHATLSDERYVHPSTAARIAIKDGWNALSDRIPAGRDWNHWDAEAARVIEAANEMNLGIEEL